MFRYCHGLVNAVGMGPMWLLPILPSSDTLLTLLGKYILKLCSEVFSSPYPRSPCFQEALKLLETWERLFLARFL